MVGNLNLTFFEPSNKLLIISQNNKGWLSYKFSKRPLSKLLNISFPERVHGWKTLVRIVL